jgi:RNA polymerase sigma factor (TIGR02999 family)
MADVTHILSAIDAGDPHAADQLLPLVYDELRKLAAQQLAQEKPGQTLEATALVHEAYLRLVPSAPTSDASVRQPQWNSRGHFFAAAAEAMRRILVDQARRKGSRKRGGRQAQVALPDLARPDGGDPLDLLALDEALQALQEQHPDKAELVKLRFFAGCTLEETADLLGISRATAQRNWSFARAWLYGRINPA